MGNLRQLIKDLREPHDRTDVSDCKMYDEMMQGDYHYCPNCGAKMDGETEHGSTYSLGKIEVPKGAIEQIIADGERKDGEG